MRAYPCLCFAALAMTSSLAVVCSSCADDPSALPPLEDGGGPNPLPDSGAPEDDANTADQKKPPRTCTEEGFCHTAVPKQHTYIGVWGDGEGNAWIVSKEGSIFRWDGATWTLSHAPNVELFAIWGSGPTDLWVSSLNGLLHGTGPSADAITWTSVKVDVPTLDDPSGGVWAIRSLWGSGANDVWAVGYHSRADAYDSGRVFHYTGPTPNPSLAWKVDPVSTAQPARFVRVWGTGENDVWIAGDNHYIEQRVLHRVPGKAGGFVWNDHDVRYMGSVVGGASMSPSSVFVFGDLRIFEGTSEDNGGTFTWEQRTDSFGAFYQFATLWASAANDVWLAGRSGWFVHWDGARLRAPAIAVDDIVPVYKDFYAIWANGKDDMWLVGDEIALHKGPQEKR